jgi:hypothetical protein
MAKHFPCGNLVLSLRCPLIAGEMIKEAQRAAALIRAFEKSESDLRQQFIRVAYGNPRSASCENMQMWFGKTN